MKTVALILVGAAGITAFVGYLLAQSLISTGPNCPGKDPAWIGWCDEAPE